MAESSRYEDTSTTNLKRQIAIRTAVEHAAWVESERFIEQPKRNSLPRSRKHDTDRYRKHSPNDTTAMQKKQLSDIVQRTNRKGNVLDINIGDD